jgi:hypothetical protein
MRIGWRRRELDKGSKRFFFEKRSKKLLTIGFQIACGVHQADNAGHAEGNSEPSIKSFLVLFFKKELLPFT